MGAPGEATLRGGFARAEPAAHWTVLASPVVCWRAVHSGFCRISLELLISQSYDGWVSVPVCTIRRVGLAGRWLLVDAGGIRHLSAQMVICTDHFCCFSRFARGSWPAFRVTSGDSGPAPAGRLESEGLHRRVWRASMRRLRRPSPNRRGRDRRGVATLDYILVLCIILPLAAFVIPTGRRMIALVFEMIAVLVSWPFM